VTRVALLLALLGLTVLACDGSDGSPDGGSAPSPGPANAAESAALKQALAARPEVLRVDGGYTRGPTNAAGAVTLSITVRPGSELDHVAQEAVKAVWLSRLAPLGSMTVTVGPDDDPGAAIDVHADFTDDRDRLTSQYGPRPIS
jgi:hypothetical protein